jgi:hypothetical protein
MGVCVFHVLCFLFCVLLVLFARKEKKKDEEGNVLPLRKFYKRGVFSRCVSSEHSSIANGRFGGMQP